MSVHRAPLEDLGEDNALPGTLREKQILFCQETLFTGETKQYTKEGSGNGQLSP
jgi:hypothetical protein